MVKPKLLVCLLGFFLFLLVVSPVFAVNNTDAEAAIGRAESRMSLAYESVLGAEKEGANVSRLLSKLNDSSALLSMAKIHYRIGNYSGAMDFADLCYDSLDGIETEASRLRESAVIERKKRLLIAGLGSAFTISVVLYAGIFGWRFFRDKYYKRVLKMKPEVQASDSG